MGDAASVLVCCRGRGRAFLFALKVVSGTSSILLVLYLQLDATMSRVVRGYLYPCFGMVGDPAAFTIALVRIVSEGFCFKARWTQALVAGEDVNYSTLNPILKDLVWRGWQR